MASEVERRSPELWVVPFARSLSLKIHEFSAKFLLGGFVKATAELPYFVSLLLLKSQCALDSLFGIVYETQHGKRLLRNFGSFQGC